MFVEPLDDEENLQQFCNNLHKFTRFQSFQELATLTYADNGDATKDCCVSSVAFDHDGTYFAVAGLTMKIKVCIVCSRICGCVHACLPVYPLYIYIYLRYLSTGAW